MNKEVSQVAYSAFSRYLIANSGLVLGDAKQYLVRSRLTPIMRQFDYDDINNLLNDTVAGRNSRLSAACIEAMTTNETLWFRDQYPFHILTNLLLPNLAMKKASLRIWSCACSTGQEPYSIAMTIAEFQQKHPQSFRNGVEILATDISAEVLKHAEQATYDQLSLSRGLPSHMMSKYMQQINEQEMMLKPGIRQLVKFRALNLLDKFNDLGQFDIVFCRNVLIYFDTAHKTKVLQNISACLPQGGALMLGASESLAGADKLFDLSIQPAGLYYVKT